MSKKVTAYHRPKNLTEALRLLAQPGTRPLAGGAHLLAQKVGGAVVDLQDLGLNQVRQEDGWLLVGAATRLQDLVHFLAGQAAHEAASTLLQQAIHRAGPNTYRHAATPGGVIARRLADSELLAAMLVLQAELTLLTPAEAHMSLADYLDSTARVPGLITQIQIPWGAGRGSSHRVARTPADTPIVSVTAWQLPDGAVRLAATGIGERPFRLLESESALAPGLSNAAIEAAATAARSACRHPGDFRGHAAYRAEMAAVLTRRCLQEFLPSS